MSLLADLLRDCRYSARALMRTPGFTVVAVVVFALGIGANSAIFSLVSAVWLKPLPFADAERLVISEGFWLRRLAGDPAAVGRTIDLDGSPHMVVGVVPRDFLFYWYSVAKLRTGVGVDAARAGLRTASGTPHRGGRAAHRMTAPELESDR